METNKPISLGASGDKKEMNPAITLWNDVINNPVFRNLPFKIETTRQGALFMSPASNWHGSAQSQIGYSLRKRKKGGEVINECSILTNEGVKVADVAWASDEFMTINGYKTPYLQAPEICVEIVSPNNTKKEIESKVKLYLSKGAIEVWVVHENTKVSVYNKMGAMKKSKMVKMIDIVKKY